MRFYILGVEDLFCVGDRILRVENTRLAASLISWGASQIDILEYFQWQLDFIDEQCFTLLPLDVIILNLRHEGNQLNLFV